MNEHQVHDMQLNEFCEQLRRAFTGDLAICLVRRQDGDRDPRTFTGLVIDGRAYSQVRPALTDAVMMLLESADNLLKQTGGIGKIVIEFANGQQIPVSKTSVEHFTVERRDG